MNNLYLCCLSILLSDFNYHFYYYYHYYYYYYCAVFLKAGGFSLLTAPLLFVGSSCYRS